MIIAGEKIKVLYRSMKYGVCCKIRMIGRDGHELSDEALFLSENPERLRELKEGKVIKL
jgi:hypothetical protein